jgi:hypothetical protein
VYCSTVAVVTTSATRHTHQSRTVIPTQNSRSYGSSQARLPEELVEVHGTRISLLLRCKDCKKDDAHGLIMYLSSADRTSATRFLLSRWSDPIEAVRLRQQENIVMNDMHHSSTRCRAE